MTPILRRLVPPTPPRFQTHCPMCSNRVPIKTVTKRERGRLARIKDMAECQNCGWEAEVWELPK